MGKDLRARGQQNAQNNGRNFSSEPILSLQEDG